jgi:hypothetical protein
LGIVTSVAVEQEDGHDGVWFQFTQVGDWGIEDGTWFVVLLDENPTVALAQLQLLMDVLEAATVWASGGSFWDRPKYLSIHYKDEYVYLMSLVNPNMGD